MSEKKNTPKIASIEFAAVETPIMKKEKSKDYVGFGKMKGYVNNYPQYLVDLYYRSAKHKALIDGKVDFVVGRGFCISNDTSITNEQRAYIESWMSVINSTESLNELSKDVIFDHTLHGGYYLEIILSKDKKSIAEVNHIDFRYIRKNEEGTEFFFTKDWTGRKPENNEDYEVIPAFDVNDKKDKSILAVGKGLGVYPLPSYLPAINHIEADYELSKFDLCNIQHQFMPSFLINFYNGEPSEPDKDEIERRINEKWSGADNAGKVIINWSDSKDTGSEIQMITPSNLADQYEVLEDRIDSTLLVAHKVINPILFGWVREGSGLSNNADELRIAQEAYQIRFATPQQEQLNTIFNNILGVNGMPKVLEIKPLDSINAQLTSATMEANLTQDEIRAKMGLEPIEGVEIDPVAEALDSLGQLLSTKVLEQMSTQEIRRLVGLPEVPVVRESTMVVKEFSSQEAEDIILNHFSVGGFHEDLFEVVSSKELECESHEEFLLADELARMEFGVIDGLTQNELSVLNAIKENPTVTVPELESITGLGEAEVNSIVEKLESTGAIKEGGTPEAPEREVTKDGEDTIEEAKKSELQVMYKYTLRSDAPPLKGKSRDFCIRMMATKSLFTRDRISGLSNGMGLDVFKYRGGYYNNPNGRTTKFCRHVWSQQIVRRK